MHTAGICTQLTKRGFWFDRNAGRKLERELRGRLADIETEIVSAIPPWYKKTKPTVCKRGMKRKVETCQGVKIFETTTGAPSSKLELIVFNPASRQHIAKFLLDRFDWTSPKLTDSGQPEISDETLKDLPWPEAKQLCVYLMLQKRIGQLSDGKNGWFKLLTDQDRIHGRINTLGAVTGRCTHSTPNLAQVPSNGAPYGPECRALFGAAPNHYQLGADLSGIELRILAHYMAPWDKGAYAEVILNGDVHWVNAQAAGFITEGTIRNKHNPTHEAARNMAKTFIYSMLYGAGDENIGFQLLGEEGRRLYKTHEAAKKAAKKLGKKARAAFLKALPALNNLIESVKARAAKTGHLRGLDGRVLRVRSAHSALNTLLQSGGAVVAKEALCIFDNSLTENGLKGRVHVIGFIHDEYQMEIENEIDPDLIKTLVLSAMQKAGENLKLRIRIDGEAKHGRNWAECH
ncbi:DNA polymerase [Iodobacter sp.]|uniref:DNA polymerase n=1 Tax=Iodobacter sp. TaxID=1915058 RepID=UPI0025DEF876|nr:DNA polymerase [Iodobacter sp.]